MNQKVAVKMLESVGYRVDIAQIGLEVLQALDVQKYVVILMDIQMPEMDGVEASVRIRERYKDRTRPRIIALTANALTADKDRYLSIGMDDYVSKPIKLEDLAEALSRCGPMDSICDL